MFPLPRSPLTSMHILLFAGKPNLLHANALSFSPDPGHCAVLAVRKTIRAGRARGGSRPLEHRPPVVTGLLARRSRSAPRDHRGCAPPAVTTPWPARVAAPRRIDREAR